MPAKWAWTPQINYVAFRGGGEAISAILGGNVTVGGSGFAFAEYITTGKMKPIGAAAGQRLKGAASSIPTLEEQGINVEIGNWRGVYGAPGISAAQRTELIAQIEEATKSEPGPKRCKRTTGHLHGWAVMPSPSLWTTSSPACAPPWPSLE